MKKSIRTLGPEERKLVNELTSLHRTLWSSTNLSEEDEITMHDRKEQLLKEIKDAKFRHLLQTSTLSEEEQVRMNVKYELIVSANNLLDKLEHANDTESAVYYLRSLVIHEERQMEDKLEENQVATLTQEKKERKTMKTNLKIKENENSN